MRSAEEAFMLLTQRHRVRYSAFPKIYFDVVEIYRPHWFEENGHRLENVDQTLVPASGKLVVQ